MIANKKLGTKTRNMEVETIVGNMGLKTKARNIGLGTRIGNIRLRTKAINKRIEIGAQSKGWR